MALLPLEELVDFAENLGVEDERHVRCLQWLTIVNAVNGGCHITQRIGRSQQIAGGVVGVCGDVVSCVLDGQEMFPPAVIDQKHWMSQ